MQRRQFLQATATCSALAMSNRVVLGDSGNRIKVGQIGTTHAHAAGQIETVRKLEELYEVVGVVEPDATRRQQLEGHRAYNGVRWLTEEELLNTPGMQVVAVETEVRDALATAARCIEAGVHVYLDKPAGESLSELVNLHRAARDRSLTIQMGYMYRYNPAFKFVFQAVRDGWLGQVFEVHGVMSKTVNNSTRRELAAYQGGSMFELGCHLIDPLLFLMGTPQNVTSFNRQTRPDDNLLDNTFAVFEYERATASIRSALVEVDGFRRRQFVVCGDQGTIVIRPLEPPQLEMTLRQKHGEFDRGSYIVELPSSPGRYHGAWTELAEVIRGEKKFPFSHEHDIAVQRSILVASGYTSWREAKRKETKRSQETTDQKGE